jgi:hypothetical protein
MDNVVKHRLVLYDTTLVLLTTMTRFNLVYPCVLVVVSATCGFPQ